MAAWPAAVMVFRKHAGPKQRGRASSVDLGIESSFRHPDVVCFITFVSDDEPDLDRTLKPAFQTNSKFFKTQPSRPQPRPNLPKKKAWLPLDPLFRNGPFHELAPTPRAFFLSPMENTAVMDNWARGAALCLSSHVAPDVDAVSHRKSMARSSVLQKYLFRKPEETERAALLDRAMFGRNP